MITITTAESALKNIYLESVIHEINTKTNPFLTMIGDRTKTIAEKDAKAYVRYGNEGSVAAGEEDGILPTNKDTKTAEIIVPLKNLYGSFQITDKAIKAAQNNPGAFTSLIGGEMKNLVDTAQNNLNRMVYGNGNPYLAYTSHWSANAFYMPARFSSNFSIGTRFLVFNSNNQKVCDNVLTVEDMQFDPADSSRFGIVFTGGSVVDTRFDRYYIYPEFSTSVEMNGIDSIFLPDSMYNLNKSEYQEILPFIDDAMKVIDNVRPVQTVLDEERLLEFFDGLEEHTMGRPSDIIMTHPTIRKSLFESLKNNRSNIDVAEFEGGFRGFTFNGVPLYADIRCLAGTVYALDTNGFAMQQLVDWTWLEGEDGSILKPVSGKPVFSATLVKYADLVCEKPFLQGKLTGFSALKWR